MTIAVTADYAPYYVSCLVVAIIPSLGSLPRCVLPLPPKKYRQARSPLPPPNPTQKALGPVVSPSPTFDPFCRLPVSTSAFHPHLSILNPSSQAASLRSCTTSTSASISSSQGQEEAAAARHTNELVLLHSHLHSTTTLFSTQPLPVTRQRQSYHLSSSSLLSTSCARESIETGSDAVLENRSMHSSPIILVERSAS